MSVLINMEMPESCKYCRFYSPLVGFMCIAANKKYGDDFNPFCKKRPDWCPLVEIKPHGRLIDADAINPEDEIWDKKCILPLMVYNAWLIAGEMPTIIEEER